MQCPYQAYNGVCPLERCIYSRIPPASSQLNVSETEISNQNNMIRENLRVPVFSGQVSPRILERVNNNIKNDILEFKNQMEQAAKENAEDSKKKGKQIIPYEISNYYLITYNKNNILSVSLIYQEKISGKNSFIRTTYNYDIRTGESMPLRSLFKSGVNYIDVLNKKIKENLEANKQSYLPGSIEKFKGIALDQPYYLEDSSLDIFLNFNEIAPVATEIPVVKIPLLELSDILRPQFNYS